MANYSKQREAILTELRSRHDHPTAAQIYEGVQKTLPHISLGTVYRNLSSLVESGEIICLSVGDGHEHFDGDKSLHLHLHCRCCGDIIDRPLHNEDIPNSVLFDGFVPESSVCVVYGICKNCQNQ